MTYLLDPRPLDEGDLAWLTLFDCGDEPWEREVTGFLRSDAWQEQQSGRNRTTPFSLPDRQELVGYITAAPSALTLTARGQNALNTPNDRLPVILVPFLGVNRAYQRRTEHFGEEIHTRFLRSIAGSMAAPRWVYLCVWPENPAVRFYQRLGYRKIGEKMETRPDGATGVVFKMVLDLERIAPLTGK